MTELVRILTRKVDHQRDARGARDARFLFLFPRARVQVRVPNVKTLEKRPRRRMKETLAPLARASYPHRRRERVHRRRRRFAREEPRGEVHDPRGGLSRGAFLHLRGGDGLLPHAPGRLLLRPSLRSPRAPRRLLPRRRLERVGAREERRQRPREPLALVRARVEERDAQGRAPVRRDVGERVDHLRRRLRDAEAAGDPRGDDGGEGAFERFARERVVALAAARVVGGDVGERRGDVEDVREDALGVRLRERREVEERRLARGASLRVANRARRQRDVPRGRRGGGGRSSNRNPLRFRVGVRAREHLQRREREGLRVPARRRARGGTRRHPRRRHPRRRHLPRHPHRRRPRARRPAPAPPRRRERRGAR